VTAERSLAAVGREVADLLGRIDGQAFDAFVEVLRPPERVWFCTGQGRSGLVARMSAMRLMHLGRRVHAVGEATAPAIRSGDGLLVLSASGATASSAGFAEIASAQGALVVLVTTNPTSALARLADFVLEIPTGVTRQFAGSLFEQTSLLVLDAAVLALSNGDPATYREMHQRHTNLQ
jgi:6-phospho-3-hexuloisomerase